MGIGSESLISSLSATAEAFFHQGMPYTFVHMYPPEWRPIMRSAQLVIINYACVDFAIMQFRLRH